MFRLKSLRQKLIACFLLLTLLPLAGTTLYGLFFTRSVLSDQALERSAFQVDLQVESIAGALRQVQNDIEYLHALRSLNMLRQQTDSEQIALWQREVANDMLVLASVRPMYHSVNLYDKSGDPMVLIETHDDTVAIVGPRDSVASNSAFIPEEASGVFLPADTDQAFAADSGSAFRKTLVLPIGQAYVSSVQFDDEEDIPFIRYSVRLPDSVLMIDLHPGWLLRSLPQHPGADTWAMIDQDGQFWVYPAGFDVASVADDIPHLLIGASGRYETPTYSYAFDVIHPTDRTLASPSPELLTEQDGSRCLTRRRAI
ncbi:MAG: hypothetical protein IPK19_38310 [Chloroflexi bacterium]|nr:hypothetical protein [Chloroflexota bacterium]